MRRFPIFALLVSLATPVVADDRTDCAAGIGEIRAALTRAVPAPLLTRLRAALRVAEREQGEAEFDECMDAVRDARRALAQ